ncbi:MAG TPA: DUF983 domain-containing protein [Chloroflexota bacterium]|nr:DUF983 domain-containing protein [Chloroflexota bacterium]
MIKRVAVLFSRALRLRCPACAGGPLIESWFRFRAVCPGCGFRLERDDGYYTGAAWLNLIVAEAVFALVLVGALYFTLPSPPWSLLLWGSIALVIVCPLAFYPFSKTLWIAFDLLFRPVERHEFDRHKKSEV